MVACQNKSEYMSMKDVKKVSSMADPTVKGTQRSHTSLMSFFESTSYWYRNLAHKHGVWKDICSSMKNIKMYLLLLTALKELIMKAVPSTLCNIASTET